MKEQEVLSKFDISDYHRLEFLGDDVSDILTVVLKNIDVGVGLFEVGEQIRALYLNEGYFRCVGYEKENYLGIDNVLQTLYLEDAEGFYHCVMENAPNRKYIYYIVRGYKGNGETGWFEIKGVPIENRINRNPIYLTVITDISDKKEKEMNISELREANRRLVVERERYKILEATAQGLLFEYYPDTDTMVFSYNFPDNKKHKEIPHYNEYVKKNPLVHSSHSETFKMALSNACKREIDAEIEYLSAISGGGYRWHKTYYKSLAGEDGKIVSVIGRICDIHDEKLRREMLNYRAAMDGLTGLYRKEAAFEKMQEYINESPTSEFYFVILDLDDFKAINDQYGHQYGDKVLKQAADMQKRLFGEASIIGRFGGDEFMILTRNIPSREVIANLETLKKSFQLCAGMVRIHPKETIQQVFDRADQAMYKMKVTNKNAVCYLEE